MHTPTERLQDGKRHRPRPRTHAIKWYTRTGCIPPGHQAAVAEYIQEAHGRE